ncbi:hypothetical protein BS50DRAFT_580444, partial [Corynespora cassiicola Philippines]
MRHVSISVFDFGFSVSVFRLWSNLCPGDAAQRLLIISLTVQYSSATESQYTSQD